MIQILYTHDHATRGSALASTIGARHGLIGSTDPQRIRGLDTLTFWGHGDPGRFCERTPSDMVKLIRKWKDLNGSLKTVELITCNARHCTSGDPLAKKIKSALHRNIFRSTSRLKVKALPVTVTGKRNAFSILLAETVHKSWVYVTAPGTNDSLMMQAQNLIRWEQDEEGRSFCFKGDMAARANQVVRDNPDRQWTMNYGYFNTLRANLVAV